MQVAPCERAIAHSSREESMPPRTLVSVLLSLLAGCSTLGALSQVLQAPRFSVARSNQPQIQLLGPSVQRPLGGVSVRLWADVANPNPIGVVLSSLQGNLALEGVRAADVSFPLGLPLAASQDTVIPLDISVGFSELPRLAGVIQTAFTRGTVAYRLDGTVGVDAGMLGRPS